MKRLASIFLSGDDHHGISEITLPMMVRSANSLYSASQNSVDNDLEPNIASLVATYSERFTPNTNSDSV